MDTSLANKPKAMACPATVLPVAARNVDTAIVAADAPIP